MTPDPLDPTDPIDLMRPVHRGAPNDAGWARDTVADDPALRFTLPRYLADRWPCWLLEIVCMGGVAVTVMGLGGGVQATAGLLVFMAVVFAAMAVLEYGHRARFWKMTSVMVESAQRSCDLDTFLAEPDFLEGRLAYRMGERLSVLANKERADALEESEGYRSYIELWIHETKTPIAAAKLVAQRLDGAEAHAMARELERIERQVEQALYYARSTAVSNDYEIREADLSHLCSEVCKRNARFLIEHGVTPVFDIPQGLTVLTDEPWLLFMVGQVVINAVQYGARTITFSAVSEEVGTPRGHTVLTIRDDGDGIAEADMPRVFERGFTGANGRGRGNATGMGLYLVAAMSHSLGLGLSITSEEGVGTSVRLDLPHDRRAMLDRCGQDASPYAPSYALLGE